MKSKTLYYLIGAIALLLGVWFALPLFDQSTRERSATREFQTINERQVIGFTMHSVSETLVFNKEHDTWYISEYLVDTDRLSRMWDAFEQVSLSGPVSKNADNHEAFEVDELTGTRATFSLDDQTTVDLIIGKSGNSFDTSYIRYVDEEDVYVASKNLQSILSADLDDWRSKTVVLIDHRDVVRIEYVYQEETFQIEKVGEDNWELVFEEQEQPVSVNQETLGMMFANLNPLRADGFSEAEETEQEHYVVIRFISDTGEVVAEITASPSDDDWLVQRSGDDAVFEVPHYRLSNILLTLDGLTEDAN